MTVNREEFAEAYKRGDSYLTLCRDFGIKERVARRLTSSLGLLPRQPKPYRRAIPADFREVSQRLGITAARLHYNVAWDTIYRWCNDIGFRPDTKKPTATRPMKKVEVPADWADVAPTKYKIELSAIYNISVKMVDRLIKMTGIRSRLTAHEIARFRPQTRQVTNKTSSGYARHFKTFSYHSEMPRTAPQEAAQHLRRFYPNVHRCDIMMRVGSASTWGDEHGVPNHGKGFYRVMPVGVMTEVEMVLLAVQKGFTW